MKNKLVSLVAGPTDKTKIFRFGKISKEDYSCFLKDRGRVLSRYISRVNLIPDDGVPLDIAKAYKKAGGELVVGYVPREGAPSLKKYFGFCDEIEEFDSGWSGLNTCLSLRGDIVTVFGLSPGTLVEVAYTKYHTKYIEREMPVLIDESTISGILPPELLDEVKLLNFSSSKELDKILRGIVK